MDTPMDTATGTASARLADLADRFQAHRWAGDPLAATTNGQAVHRDRLPDLTPAGEQARRDRALALREQVAAVPPQGLDEGERTSRDMLLTLLAQEAEVLAHAWAEIGVDAYRHGPQRRLLQHLPRIDVHDAAAADDLLARLGQVRGYLEDAHRRHLDGLARGRTPVHRGVAAAIAQSRAVAAAPASTAHLLTPLRSWEGLDTDRRDRAERTWDHVVAPAFAAYADRLQADVVAHARPDDRAGLCWLPDGDDVYDAVLRRYTTLPAPDPDVIHRTGLEVVAELADAYAAVGGRHLGVTDLTAITARLHDDPALHFPDASAIVAHAQQVVDAAQQAIRGVFGRLPSTPCVVRAIPEVESSGAPSAFYLPPAEDRPVGTYWVNTTAPPLPRFKAEATAFHEAAPGHHTQLALQQELDLPAFRRAGGLLSGYVEGWGLYAERLADELGLYSGDLTRIGMLATSSLRACRLVVDTGLHHRGWSRQQAIDYLRANSPLPDEAVVAEVDRYLVQPGQACAYLLGRLEIDRLRADAEARLGADFDLRGFHDAVLGEGSVPLGVLDAIVDRWIDRARPRG